MNKQRQLKRALVKLWKENKFLGDQLRLQIEENQRLSRENVRLLETSTQKQIEALERELAFAKAYLRAEKAECESLLRHNRILVQRIKQAIMFHDKNAD